MSDDEGSSPAKGAAVWPFGDGEMARHIRAYDWSATPLGRIETWPQSLRTIVDLMMANPVANILVYGHDRVLIYNDACIPLYGDKHPRALGTKGPEAFPELWGEIGPLYDRVFAGEQFSFRAQPWAFERGMAPRAGLYDAYFTPGRDETGQVAFAYVTAIEVTDRERAKQVLRESEERQAFLLKFSDALRAEPNADGIVDRALRMLAEELKLDRCYATVMFPAEDRVDITHEFRRPDLAPMPSLLRFSDFPEAGRRTFDRTLIFNDTANDPELTEADKRSLAAMSFGALLSAPVRRGAGNPIWALGAVSSQPRHWAPAEVVLLEQVAERTWAAVERARAEAALQESEKEHRLLFDSIDQGFCVINMLFDDAGKPFDYRFVQANPAFQRQTGLTDAIGRTMREMAPDHEEHWYEIYGRIALTGEPERFENEAAALGHSYEVYAFRIGEPEERRVAILFNDIGARKQAEQVLRESEERKQFLLELSDTLRAEPNADAIAERAIRMLSEQLRLDRCYAASYWPAADRADITHQVGNDAVPPLPAMIRLSDFPAAFRQVFDQTLIIDDVAETAGLSDTDRRNIEGLGMRALAAATLRKGENNPLWVVVAVTAAPRRWTRGDIALLEEVTERTWAAMARARAEAALRASEADLEAKLRRTALLQELALRLVSEESLPAIYDEILSTAIGIMESDAGTVQVYDPETSSLALLVTRGIPHNMIDHFQRIDVASSTACGTALRTGQRSFVDFGQDEADEACRVHVEAGYRSAQATPLISRNGSPIGMINTHWRSSGFRPSEDQLRFLDLLARQAADLIERAHAEAALRESEGRFRQFGDASSDVLWIRDAENLQWEYLSPAFEVVYGVDRAEALRPDNLDRWTEFILNEDREHVLEQIRRVSTGERVTFEFRIRRPSDGEVRWLRDTDFPLKGNNGRVERIGGIAQDITDEKETSDRLQVLISELQHRTRNLIAVVRGLADRTRKETASLDEFLARYSDRLGAISRVQGLLSRLDDGHRVAFDELLLAELKAHGAPDEGSDRVKLEGPAGVPLRSRTVQTLALALHELATNAVKYGALSSHSGHLGVRWHLEVGAGTPELHVDWHESGVEMPADATPQGGGYGRELIEQALPYQLGARTSYKMGPDGIRCTIALPISEAVAAKEEKHG